MLVLSIGTIVGAPIKRQSSDDSKLTTLYGGVELLGVVLYPLTVGEYACIKFLTLKISTVNVSLLAVAKYHQCDTHCARLCVSLEELSMVT